jgi:hypothetical protein
MRVDDGPKLDQPGERELRRAYRDRGANRGISHPSGKLPRETRPYLDVEDLTTATAMPCVQTNPLPVKRMPRILHYDELRVVC